MNWRPSDTDIGRVIARRLTFLLNQHLAGLQAKADSDFSADSFDKELASLTRDPVYSSFAFARPEYVLIRLMGRMSISIGRRLGEIYDKLPRFVAVARFGLPESDVVAVLDGLELDLALSRSLLSPTDASIFDSVAAKWFGSSQAINAFAVEIRYNFNPNDSSRLRKDVRMAQLAGAAGFYPVYLVFCTISPRTDAISRLKRAGWAFLIGSDAEQFLEDLFGVPMMALLQDPAVRDNLRQQVDSVMKSIFAAPAFLRASAIYFPRALPHIQSTHAGPSRYASASDDQSEQPAIPDQAPP